MFEDMNLFHPEDWINWLSNDLYSFMNDYVPTMYGYTPNFYKKMLRIPIIHPYYREMMFGKKHLVNSLLTLWMINNGLIMTLCGIKLLV